MNKNEWGPGEWQHEPDEMLWKDEITGLPCAIRRSDSIGVLCGYVGVPKNHPYYHAYSSICVGLSVHGGITFAGNLYDDYDIWWIGFDCGQPGDYSPRLKMGGKYRNFSYARQQVFNLAKQLAEIKNEEIQ